MAASRNKSLYDPSFEKDGCGIGFVAQIQGRKSHSILAQGLEVLSRLQHRGAEGADGDTGDGAGILIQHPHEFFCDVAAETGIFLPVAGQYATGMMFLPRDAKAQAACESVIARVAEEEGSRLLGVRWVATRPEGIGRYARETEPAIRQFFFARPESVRWDDDAFERKLYLIRRRIEKEMRGVAGCEAFYVCSLSHRTIVYKGMLQPSQLAGFYPDLTDPRLTTAIALVHSRFSTNTFPSWRLAHPFRMISHNGEINTLKGNINWMRARQSRLQSKLFGDDVTRLFPIVEENQSDSACLDNALEFLVQGGRSLPHAMMMLIPEPWVANPKMDLARRSFYEFHSAMMEPWDGPAAVCFTDGRWIGATLDRNGLRPCRYFITDEDVVVLASEAGTLEIPASRITRKGRLEPGKMFLVDTVRGSLVDDEEIKREVSSRRPYRAWVTQNAVSLDEMPEPLHVPQPDEATLRQRQRAFGYTSEEVRSVLAPMAIAGEEPISSMGNDTPLAVLSDRPKLLFKYFRQMFAQVTNPPIDPIREQLVMSLVTNIGPKPNLLSETPEAWRRIKVSQPILTNEDLARLREIHESGEPFFRTITLPMLFRAEEGAEGLRAGVARLCRKAAQAVSQGCKFLILSDRGMSDEWAPIPSLLAVAAVNNHLVRRSMRAEVGLIVESGEPRDVHHFACLLGYGAGTINPYLALETLNALAREKLLPEGIDAATAREKYVKAVGKGLLKIFSKMGISTAQSYCGAQLFEAIGLSSEVARKYFTGTPSRVEGLGMRELGEETLRRHAQGYTVPSTRLELGGEIHYRAQGEHHNWNPETIAKLQHATRSADREQGAKTFKEFSALVNDESRRRSTLRGLLEFVDAERPVSLSEVEPASAIVKRFTTGAMSLGALGPEAHETLAIAMNRIGAKSNSGEGGEDAARFTPDTNGDSRSSAIKQIASARFGVTAHYLVNARELQIKMAQGAKPGEGGQLPGHKVDEMIARLRHSTPGVSLISPPPHHDIYSIEDLKELIFDLKNANPAADVSVKLVAEVGVGTIAAGVAKAKADKILISGDSGGTGASPLASIKYAGIPWELGLAETQQTLVRNGLRGRVKLETDGQMKTGRDVAIAALLGAEEFGFSTAPLIVEGCIMMRKCHLNTCPVGVATQDPELRKRFTGQPEHVINYFFFVAEELRELMARLGFRTVAEMVGRVDRLKFEAPKDHWKARGLDLSALLAVPTLDQASRQAGREGNVAQLSKSSSQDHGIERVLDRELIRLAGPALSKRERVTARLSVRNSDRALGTMLSGEVAKRFGAEGLPAATIDFELAGSVGQSFGAFLARGVRLRLEGEANDYVGKGLSGGVIAVRPPADSLFDPDDTIIVGNTVLYGATEGEAYFRGRAGERFAVRNSGATTVVEGTGDHGCEYMTGGTVLVLGRTGRNFAAGMSGGVAYVLDEDGGFAARCNLGMVGLEKPSADDAKLIRMLLERHLELTTSAKAELILSDFDAWLTKFTKVMPTDYKRVLEERARASEPRVTKQQPRMDLSNGSAGGEVARV